MGGFASARPAYAAVVVLLALLGAASSCGYQIAGRANALPDTIGVIAIPPFKNETVEFKVEQHLTRAVTREFISRTRYRVVADEALGDAVLTGAVVNVLVFPAVFDPQTGRATSISTITQIRVLLRDRKTGEVLYENPNLEHRERYEVSTDPNSYFEERESALMRTSEAAARNLVSAVLEKF
ncbi:MAG: LPS assembly lipoprotein LptE [Acidobacteria bacterium]|nr:LPS assembly lipoprotein LptE [Acidobacteriota bacterium]